MKQIESDLLSGGQLRTPTKIPAKVQMIKEEAPPPLPGGGVVGAVPGGIPGGQAGSDREYYQRYFQPFVHTQVATGGAPADSASRRGITSGLLLRKVEPSYPVIARAARIQGDVVLKAVIDRDGSIQDLQVGQRTSDVGTGGHPGSQTVALQALSAERATG